MTNNNLNSANFFLVEAVRNANQALSDLKEIQQINDSTQELLRPMLAEEYCRLVTVQQKSPEEIERFTRLSKIVQQDVGLQQLIKSMNEK